MQSCRKVRSQICQVAPRDLDRFLFLLLEATSRAFHNQGERSVGSAVYMESSHTPSGTKTFEVVCILRGSGRLPVLLRPFYCSSRRVGRSYCCIESIATLEKARRQGCSCDLSERRHSTAQDSPVSSHNSCAVSTIRGEACCFDRCHRHLVSSGAQPIEEMIVAVAMNCFCDRVGSLHVSTSIDKHIGTTQETASRLRTALSTYFVGI